MVSLGSRPAFKVLNCYTVMSIIFEDSGTTCCRLYSIANRGEVLEDITRVLGVGTAVEVVTRLGATTFYCYLRTN